jgi:hypothetical protein
MYFDSYKQHTDATMNPSLWEYDMQGFDFEQMRNIVVQRVVERGWHNDWYAALNMYGVDGVVAAIKEVPYLNAKDMNFVCVIFDIPLSQLKCNQRKLSKPLHWNS